MRDVYLTSNKARLQKYLIIIYSEKRHLLDIAKWLRMRRKCPGRDLLLTVRLPHRHRIAGNAAVAESCLTVKPPSEHHVGTSTPCA